MSAQGCKTTKDQQVGDTLELSPAAGFLSGVSIVRPPLHS